MTTCVYDLIYFIFHMIGRLKFGSIEKLSQTKLRLTLYYKEGNIVIVQIPWLIMLKPKEMFLF